MNRSKPAPADQPPRQLQDSLRISKSLADASRLRILSELLSGERCAEELATITGLAPSTVSFHLKKLIDAGLLSSRKEQYYAVYSLRPEALELRVGDLLSFADSEQVGRDRRREDERRKVYEAFFNGGRLTRMPAQRRKRLLVLEVFASLFEAGTTYPEQKVNELIAPLFTDYCLVRRLLVDEGFMTRDRGGYGRTGKESRPAPIRVSDRNDQQSGRLPDERKIPVDSRKKQLKRDYLLDGKRAGIFQVVNRESGRRLLGSSLDVHAGLSRTEFELNNGWSRYPEFQADFARLGKEGFRWEVIETVEATDPAEIELELDLLEEKHLADMDRANSYNLPGSVRMPPKRRGRPARRA